MKKLFLVLLFVVGWAVTASAWTAIVTFDIHPDPKMVTGVFVTEIQGGSTFVIDPITLEEIEIKYGDYSDAYGQMSEPGASTVAINNIKPETTYYFKARRYDPTTWEYSEWSEEKVITSGEYAQPRIRVFPGFKTPVIKDVSVE